MAILTSAKAHWGKLRYIICWKRKLRVISNLILNSEMKGKMDVAKVRPSKFFNQLF